MKPIVLLTNTINAAGMALLEPHDEVRLASAVAHDTLRLGHHRRQGREN